MASHRLTMPQELRSIVNSPLILALMASGVVFATLSPVSAQASPVNPLAELSRTLVASSLEPTTTTTTLEGNPSLIEAGAGSVKPVVGSFVDDEVRRRPVGSSQKPGVRPAIKTVQLLIPVKTGLEFAQLQELEPTVKILEQDGKVYVLVAETSQALPAYQRGKALQAKFGYGFELAYSEGHPDLNLAWMGVLNPDVASLAKPSLRPIAPAILSASIPKANVELPKLGKASDLGILTMTASWLSEPWLAKQASPQPVPSQPISGRRPSRLEPGSPGQAIAQSVSSAIAEQITPSAITPFAPPLPTARRQSMHEILAELRSMSAGAKSNAGPALPMDQPPTSPVVAVGPPIVNQVNLASPSLIQAVAIRPTQLGTIPVLGTRFMAVNQELAYMFVKVKTADDLEAVRQVAPVSVIYESNGQLLAQIGVFPNTKAGDRLREVQSFKLQNSGVEVQLIGARPSGQRALDQS